MPRLAKTVRALRARGRRVGLPSQYLRPNFFIFGENIFRRGARGKCPACENLNFEILYLEKAPAGNYPPAKSCFYKEVMYMAIELFTFYLARSLSETTLPAEFWISKFYIPRKRLEKVPREKKIRN